MKKNTIRAVASHRMIVIRVIAKWIPRTAAALTRTPLSLGPAVLGHDEVDRRGQPDDNPDRLDEHGVQPEIDQPSDPAPDERTGEQRPEDGPALVGTGPTCGLTSVGHGTRTVPAGIRPTGTRPPVNTR